MVVRMSWFCSDDGNSGGAFINERSGSWRLICAT